MLYPVLNFLNELNVARLQPKGCVSLRESSKFGSFLFDLELNDTLSREVTQHQQHQQSGEGGRQQYDENA